MLTKIIWKMCADVSPPASSTGVLGGYWGGGEHLSSRESLLAGYANVNALDLSHIRSSGQHTMKRGQGLRFLNLMNIIFLFCHQKPRFNIDFVPKIQDETSLV